MIEIKIKKKIKKAQWGTFSGVTISLFYVFIWLSFFCGGECSGLVLLSFPAVATYSLVGYYLFWGKYPYPVIQIKNTVKRK